MIVETGRRDAAPPDPVALYMERTGQDGNARVVPLTGDASDRKYFRVIRSGEPSFVLALHSAPFDYETLPFVNVAELLGKVPLPIPRIIDHAGDLALLALEDLGDVTLQAHLGAAPAGEHSALYRQAVGFIEALQRRGSELESSAYVPYSVAFDVEKLTWEFDFFIKHFIESYRGLVLPPAMRAALREEGAWIIEELTAERRVLCHRDYHSRNLMLHDERLYIIDFQDARMGPDTYDLVSLLRDSYVDINEESVEEFIAYFLALRGKNGGPDVTHTAAGWDAREFRRRFDLMALQRNLKALGTFGFQTTARRNPVYIQYMPRTLRYARLNLLRYPRLGRLHELLASVVEEFR
jgi:N-acetylmuramate 1-kinase